MTRRPPGARPIPLPPPPQPNPEFLVVGLFALRLTKRLVEGLEYYPGRDADIAWLDDFLAPYPLEHALAKLSGVRKEGYVATYQKIVSRMKRQPRYPLRFMQMNPDRSTQRRHKGQEVDATRTREMTDSESSIERSRFSDVDTI
jgi:hypothetical protein